MAVPLDQICEFRKNMEFSRLSVVFLGNNIFELLICHEVHASERAATFARLYEGDTATIPRLGVSCEH
jgi:hypothetical protein